MKALLRRIFSLRSLLWTLASIVALYFVLVVIENRTGASALADAKAMLVREGETLDFQEVLPKPIPDAENFCAIEPLAGITSPQMEADSLPSRKRESLVSLGWTTLAAKHTTKRLPPNLNEGFDFSRRFDFNNAAAYLSEIQYLDTPVDADPAQVLAALDVRFPLLKQLAEASKDRPGAMFTPSLVIGTPINPFELHVPHYNAALESVNALVLRSHISAEAGDLEAAFRTLAAAVRLTKATAQEPLLIGMLVAVAMQKQVSHCVWSQLAQRRVSETHLARLHDDLEDIDFVQNSLRAVRGELCFSVGSGEWLKHHPEMRCLVFTNAPFSQTTEDVPWAARLIASVLPEGWIDHSKSSIIRLYFNHIITPLKSGSCTRLMEETDKLLAVIEENHGLRRLHYAFAYKSAPVVIHILRDAIYTETVRRQSLIAIALERYGLRHHKYPSTLPELVPVFLESLPLDPIDDKPMRYRQTDNGRYIIWSIGADREDDNGTPPSAKRNGHLPFVISASDYTGDWVWGYTPAQNAKK
ncbi:MAG: hypothetical protein Q8M07_08790 [Prosthecobacter sp.]|nr:hypothetical protein [Prosthecobacter sp.]